VSWVSDDGYTDHTLEILKATQKHWGENRLKIVSGPKKGFARNFLSLACHADIVADYYAFADQDDVWMPEKLSRAIKLISHYPKNSLILYGSRTRLIDARGKVIGNSTLKPRYISYHKYSLI
jgi:glycosyltransferase involved in cell wall biosynthesis